MYLSMLLRSLNRNDKTCKNLVLIIISYQQNYQLKTININLMGIFNLSFNPTKFWLFWNAEKVGGKTEKKISRNVSRAKANHLDFGFGAVLTLNYLKKQKRGKSLAL
jgi:hypothetical protein